MEPFSDNICLSGGADGADLMWGMVAGSRGHSVVHFGFKGHRSQAPKCEIVALTRAQLLEADPFLHTANETLRRKFPTSSDFTNNLLRRNWYQVRDSASCYAISTIKNGVVQGGTSWATAMFIQQNNNDPCPCFVFCQEQSHWFKWEGSWQPIYEPPSPTGIWAGVGSRDLNQIGKLAIRILLNYKNIRLYDPTRYERY